MRIGLYGMPTAGKTHVLDQVDFLEVLQGSKLLREIAPDFDQRDEIGKKCARKELARRMCSKQNFIIDGHYAFGDKIAFTEEDGAVFDVILYLYIDPAILARRIKMSAKNRRYIAYDLETWQTKEISDLREYCHLHDKDFYVLDHQPLGYFDDVSVILEFIQEIVRGYSCRHYAVDCAAQIQNTCTGSCITLLDGDRTLTIEDTSHYVFGYTTQLFNGNFYTGFQVWQQSKDFEWYIKQNLQPFHGCINDKVTERLGKDSYILTSGSKTVWNNLAKQLTIPCFCGEQMSADTKFFIVKTLQASGYTVIAYGDSMNDYYMLKQADKGYLVRRPDGSISRSLTGQELEGLILV